MSIVPEVIFLSGDELGKGRLLAKTLREHGAVIVKKNGVRWAYIPVSESLVTLKMGKMSRIFR